MDLLDEESIDDAKDEIARELCYLCDLEDVIPEKVLVVGLGNSMLTADSIGTRSAEKVKPTLHIRNRDEVFFNALECSEIAILLPGVAAKTGLDSFISVKGISDIIKPDVIFVIDALMTRAEERLGTTIQISTTGILPGSGLGNSGAELSQSTLGVPVIAIGVPTVINSRCFGRKEANLSCIKKSEMFVSPKEIGEIAEVAAEIIGGGINQAFGMTV